MRTHSLTPVILSGVMLSAASPLLAQKHAKGAPQPMSPGQMSAPIMGKDAEKAEKRVQYEPREARKDQDKELKEQEKVPMTHGIRLTREERARLREIDRRYDAQLRGLEKEMNASEKAGRLSDPAILARINTVRDQERAELRAALTPAQQVLFDRNVARLSTRR